MSEDSVWDPLPLPNGTVLPHRFVLAPMTTDSSHPDGEVSDAELAYVTRRAANGFAATLTSCAYVHPDGRTWQGIGAAADDHGPSLRRLADAYAAGDGLRLLQLYDGGRLANPELVPRGSIRAPSAVASARPGAPTPRAMDDAEVDALAGAFAAAAARGIAAGFGGVELHGANHYLLHQFMSPRSNRRADRWGATPDNRMAFALDVVTRVRDAIGAGRVLGFRLNPFEIEPGGFTLEASIRLADELAGRGVDYVHISMDDFRKNSPQPEDRDWTNGVQQRGGVSPITAIAGAVAGRCPVVASGGIRTLDHARQALALGADLLAVGRAALLDPEWLLKLRRGDPDVHALLPGTPEEIESELTIPARMARYLLSRPGWIPTRPVPETVRSTGA